MTALMWRELREHARWAALTVALAAFGFVLALQRRPADGLLDDGVLQVTTLLAPAWGLALGLLQTLPQMVPDRWALLVHRPLSRHRIVLAKAIAGTALVIAPLLLPLLAAWAWTLLPGSIAAPVDPRSLLAGLGDIACGLVYHACGLLIGLRRASWARSRLLPLGWAVLASCAVIALPEFAWALAAAVAMASIAYGAAWSAFLHGGEDGELTTPQRGLVVLLLAPAMVGAVILPLLAERWLEPEDTSYVDRSWYYQIADDGSVERVAWRDQRVPSRSHVQLSSVRLDPDGPIPRYSYRDFSRYVRVVPQFQDAVAYSTPFYRVSQRDIVIYDALTRRAKGYATHDGLRPEPESAPLEDLQHGFVAADEVVVLRGESLQSILRLQTGERVCDLTWLAGVRPHSITQYLIATNRRLSVRADDTTIDLPTPEAQGAGVAQLPDGRWAVMSYGPRNGSSLIVTVHDAQGAEVSRQELPPVEAHQPAARFAITEALIPLAPLVPVAEKFTARFTGSPIEQGEPWMELVLAAGTAIAVALTWWLARRRCRRASSVWRWALVALVLSFAAPLLLLAVHPRRIYVACPGCGARRPIEAERCPSCGLGAPPADPAAIILPRGTLTAAV